MMDIKRSLALCLSFVLVCSVVYAEPEDNRPRSYDALLEEFSDPGVDYRPAPLWVWNNDLSKEFIDENLEAFKEAGIGAVYIHPRTGLQIAYLSKEWFKWVEYAMEVAEKLGLKVWIYDEYVCPSGFAGGMVPHVMPESYNQGVGLITRRASKLSSAPDTSITKGLFKKVGDKWVNIRHDFKGEIGKEGEYMTFDKRSERTGKGIYGGYCYVDLLAKGVTEKFLEVTMTGYEKIGKKHFGNLISGIMTDEPSIAPSAGGIRYTPDLFAEFEKRWGYSLEDHLPSLVEHYGNYRKVRHDFRTVLLELFINRWSKPYYEYTEKNNLIWTGHYWENVWPDLYMGPDNMAMYAWHQMPGVDMLMNSTVKRPDQFGNNIAIKELGSVRNQFDRHRSFSETYGGSGYDLRFEDMRRNGDWQYALGVNYLNMHLSHTSLVGVRKMDYPQSFMPYAPYWNLFRHQMDYFGRLSVAMSSGKQVNRILVMEPTTSIWMYYPNSAYKRQVDSTFRKLVNTLEKYQVEYDLGCENIIAAQGRVEGRKFCINKASYDLVVLDRSVENLDAKTFALLKEYLGNGGRVLQLGDCLEYVDGDKYPGLCKLAESGNWVRKEEVTQEVVSHYLTDYDFYLTPSVSGRLHHQRRTLSDGEILFLANFSQEENAGTNIYAKGASVVKLCRESGKTEPAVYRKTGDGVCFTVDLAPGCSELYYIHKNKDVPSAVIHETKLEKLETVSESAVEMSGSNVLVLDYLDLDLMGEKSERIYSQTACNKVYKRFGFDKDPWIDVQFGTEYLDKNKDYKKGDSFTAEYVFNMSSGVDTKGMQLVVEAGNHYAVSVNGQPVKMNGKHWLDPDFKCFDIASLIKEGKNVIRLYVEKFNVLCELAPVYILGDFSLKSEKQGWSMVPVEPLHIGDWFTQGRPFFSGHVTYTRTVSDARKGCYEVDLPDWNGTVAEILVNGKRAAVITNQPYKARISLAEGKNEVSVVVYGSLKSLFGPYHVYTDGYLRPASFYVGNTQPQGEGYFLPKYGLKEEFSIYRVVE